jgi:hypothetical protein
MVIPTSSNTKVSDTTTTTTKKTRTISKAKGTETVAALLQSMLAKGLTIEQITAALKGGK